MDKEELQRLASDSAHTCAKCHFFKRCKALINTLTGAETECDFSPSRFVYGEAYVQGLRDELRRLAE